MASVYHPPSCPSLPPFFTHRPMHVIVDYRDGMFWMSASENNQVSFVTMEDLLLHYKENPIVVDSKGNKVKLLNPIPLRRTSD